MWSFQVRYQEGGGSPSFRRILLDTVKRFCAYFSNLRTGGLKDQRTRGLKGVSFIYELKGQSAHPLEDRRSPPIRGEVFPLRGKGVSFIYELKGPEFFPRDPPPKGGGSRGKDRLVGIFGFQL
uniref:Uncharacterized protein orf122 n=1 Tax=Monomastix sp. (strain OKE-1) TaxID=141716 RepID=C0JWJ7_MONSK|nr:hypothetical protein MoOKC_p013 [Monomastix sp. OKE-1]ACK36917.1 unknown [Monomastix sp. OKE-1]